MKFRVSGRGAGLQLPAYVAFAGTGHAQDLDHSFVHKPRF